MKTSTILIIGGVLALGVVGFYLYEKNTAAAPGAASGGFNFGSLLTDVESIGSSVGLTSAVSNGLSGLEGDILGTSTSDSGSLTDDYSGDNSDNSDDY